MYKKAPTTTTVHSTRVLHMFCHSSNLISRRMKEHLQNSAMNHMRNIHRNILIRPEIVIKMSPVLRNLIM